MYTSDLKLFNSKLDDAVYLCDKRRSACFTDFLTEEEQAYAEQHLRSVKFDNYEFFGGYENSERRVLGLFYDEPVSFPVEAVLFKFRKSDKLTHRDFLGSLMSLGIERDTVGDILVEDGKAVIFLKTEIKDYVVSQISKVGRTGVTISDAGTIDLPQGREPEKKEYTVSSLRIDNIVSAVSGLSREKSKNIILQGNVSINHMPCQKISRVINEGDKLTIRGRGKFEICGVIGETKKHRIRISIIHYR